MTQKQFIKQKKIHVLTILSAKINTFIHNISKYNKNLTFMKKHP